MSGAATLAAELGARTDAALAEAAGAGDGAAFAELYDRHAARVYGFCLRVLGTPHDAADATQETFLAVLVRLRDGDAPVGDVRAWLLGTARYACFGAIERRGQVAPIRSAG